MTRNRFSQLPPLILALILALSLGAVPSSAVAQDDGGFDSEEADDRGDAGGSGDDLDDEDEEEGSDFFAEDEDDGHGIAGMGAGQLFPFEGSSGTSVQISAMNKFADAPVRLGIEFAYVAADAKIRGVSGIRYDAYILQLLTHYMLPWTFNRFEPYVGGGVGLRLTAFEDAQVPDAASSIERERVGLSALLVGGVDYSFNDWIVFFGEARVSFEAPISSSARAGGWGYAVGVRLRH